MEKYKWWIIGAAVLIFLWSQGYIGGTSVPTNTNGGSSAGNQMTPGGG